MSKGLLNLEGIENMGDNDILNLNINESGNAEFGSNSPATNPTVTFDPNSTSAKDTSVPVPGGIKETPTAKPADGEVGITIPGGNGESPSAKPYDASSVSIPAKTTLTSDQYNAALAALKKSFKEGAEIMEMLESANVVHKTESELQQEYTESLLEQTLLEAYETGPIFEAVNRSDKDEVKSIVKSIRSSLPKSVKKIAGAKLYPARTIIRAVLGDTTSIWTNRLWQVLGVVLLEGPNMKTVADSLTEEYADVLGDYKILYTKVSSSLADIFRTKFGWKNSKDSYFIIIDKKLPAELKAIQKDMSEQSSGAGDAKPAKEDPKKDDK